MKIEIVVCDRCDRRLDDGAATDAASLTVQRGDARKTRDLCGLCEDELEEFLRGKPLLVAPRGKEERVQAAGLAELQLAEVRRVAHTALLSWQEGAHPDQLVEALRDVQTGARRR